MDEQVKGPLIYKAIAGVMQDIGAVGKDQVNKQQGWKFRGIDDVMNALHPAMVKHKVFVVPEIMEQNREVKTLKSGTNMIFSICKIRYTFFSEDGSSVQAIVIGEGMDSGDKATNKAMAIAFKYACFQTFCIPTEEMVDPDSERPELEWKESQKSRAPEKAKKAAVGKASVADGEILEESRAQGNEEKMPAVDGSIQITEAMLNTIHSEMMRTGVSEKTILGLFKLKSLSDINIEQFKKLMKKFEVTQDLKGGAA